MRYQILWGGVGGIIALDDTPTPVLPSDSYLRQIWVVLNECKCKCHAACLKLILGAMMLVAWVENRSMCRSWWWACYIVNVLVREGKTSVSLNMLEGRSMHPWTNLPPVYSTIIEKKHGVSKRSIKEKHHINKPHFPPRHSYISRKKPHLLPTPLSIYLSIYLLCSAPLQSASHGQPHLYLISILFFYLYIDLGRKHASSNKARNEEQWEKVGKDA